MKLQRLWIDEHGGLTAIKRNGRSMPLYDAIEVDKYIDALLKDATVDKTKKRVAR